MLPVFLLLGLLVSQPEGGAAQATPPAVEPPARGLPLDFDSEVVRLRILGDSVQVEGTYRFLCSSSGVAVVTMLYPYPADSLLGGARTLSLEARVPPEPWRAIVFAEAPDYPAAAWTVPVDWGETLEVRTVYRQRRLGDYARYIVTTTGRWRHPLRTARFEIYLPRGARPVRFSFPFRQHRADHQRYYLYEAVDFLPDRDIVVQWRR
jgi:hypothetical protein